MRRAIKGKDKAAGCSQLQTWRRRGMEEYEDHIRYCSLKLAYELNLGVVIGDRKPKTDRSSEDPSW